MAITLPRFGSAKKPTQEEPKKVAAPPQSTKPPQQQTQIRRAAPQQPQQALFAFESTLRTNVPRRTRNVSPSEYAAARVAAMAKAAEMRSARRGWTVTKANGKQKERHTHTATGELSAAAQVHTRVI